MLVSNLIVNIDESKNYNVNILDCLIWLKSSWNMLSEKTIGNCFKKAGFKKYELMLNEEIIEDFVLNKNYIDIDKETL